MQNKAKVKIGKMNISIATIKDYDKKTNNQRRTLLKTKPIKAKVNIGKIGTEWQRHIVNFITRRSSLCSFVPKCLCGYEPIILNKAIMELEKQSWPS